jgi:hypothetical protein
VTTLVSTPRPTKQLLHLVFGGELKKLTGVEFKDLDRLDIVGIYPSYTEAYKVWKGRRSAHCRGRARALLYRAHPSLARSHPRLVRVEPAGARQSPTGLATACGGLIPCDLVSTRRG